MGMRVVAVGKSTDPLHCTFVSSQTLPTDTGAEKEQLCLELGAEKWIDFNQIKDLVQAIKDACDGLGSHCAIVTSPHSQGYAQAVDYLRPGGTLMAVGLPANANLEASIFWTVFKVWDDGCALRRTRRLIQCP